MNDLVQKIAALRSFAYCGVAAHFSQHFMCLPPSTHSQAT